MTMRRRRRIEYLGKVRRAVETDTGMDLEIAGGSARVTIYSPEIIRVNIEFDAGKSEPDHSYAVVVPHPEKADFKVSSDDHEWVLDTGYLYIHINRDPFRVTVYDRSRRLLSADAKWGGAGMHGGKVYCDKIISKDEHFYGFGEKAFGIDRRGKKMQMWTTDAPAHQWNSDPLYVSIPFFIGLHSGAAYGMFFDTPWKSVFDMGGATRTYYSFCAESGGINYYFIAGPDMKDVLQRYTHLTGRAQMPPLWSLGFHQSRWSYKTEAKVRYIAEKFRELEIPCDVIHFDIHYMDGYRVFTWNDKRFPDPAGLIESLKKDGFNVVTIIDPGVKIDRNYSVYNEGKKNDYFCRKSGGGLFKGIVWPGETNFPDFVRKDVRDWWGSKVSDFVGESGHAGIWNDMNEPSVNIKPYMRRVSSKKLLHQELGRNVPHMKLRNVYGQLEAEATRDGLLEARPQERPFILTRSGFAGIQRYAAVWSGDNTSSWAHMHLSIPLLCGLGLSGVPFVGADIGGFMGNCKAELFARWIQLGVFYPFCRVHTMMLSRAQQPWSFGDRVTDIAREYISLRYRLLPYIYNTFYESARTGMPVMRPLVLEFRNDEPSFTIDDEFMFGPALLIAPILEKAARSRDVYLPPGKWIDFHTGEWLDGSRTVRAEAPLERMPIYIRAGYILPSIPLNMHTGEKVNDPLILSIYCGASASLEMYDDDGAGYPAEKECLVTRFEYSDDLSGAKLTATPVKELSSKKKYRTERTHITARFKGFRCSPERVLVNGEVMHESWATDAGEDIPFHGWSWDAVSKTLSVGIRDTGEPFALEMFY